MKKTTSIEFAYPPTVMFQADDRFRYGREPVLRRMPDGSLFSLVYSGGDREPSRRNVVAAIRSEDDGTTWSRPELLFGHPERCCWGTELFTECGKPFLAFQTFRYDTYYCELQAYFSTTEDSGRSWSEPVSVPGVPPCFVVRQGKVLCDRSILFPVYWTEQLGNWRGGIADDMSNFNELTSRWHFRSGVLRSTDGGRSYTLHGCLGNAGNVWEPEIVELEPGHLRLFARSETDRLGVLHASDSFDGGLTWGRLLPTDIPNPGTKFVIFKIRGRIVLVNNVCTPEKQNRDILEIWISDDNLKSWRRKLPLARLCRGNDAGRNQWNGISQVAYPHGFADEGRELLYLAIDAVHEFYLVKVPYADLLK